jgi:hypothetical protein
MGEQMSFERGFYENYRRDLELLFEELSKDPIAQSAGSAMISELGEVVTGSGHRPAYIRQIFLDAIELSNHVDYAKDMEDYCSLCHGSGMSFAGADNGCERCGTGCYHCGSEDCKDFGCL